MTAAAIAYLADRGFYPIETEVCVGQKPNKQGYQQAGWIADVASFCFPTMTEMRKLKLRHPRIKIESNHDELRYIYGHIFTAMVEVKTTRADFKKDLATKFNGHIYPAHLCYLAIPKDMISTNEFPRGWICLEIYPETNRVKRHWAIGEVHPQHPGDIADFCAQIAIKRGYRTRFAERRAWLKMYRAGKIKY